MATPRRPKAQPVLIDGTSIRRTYVAPGAADRPRPGDIVEYRRKQWDVVGSQSRADVADGGALKALLQLERKARQPDGKMRVVRLFAPVDDVEIAGRQVLLPGIEGLARQEEQRGRDTG